MNLAQAKRELEARSDPRVATILGRRNPGVNVIGVRFGDLQTLARAIGPTIRSRCGSGTRGSSTPGTWR